MNPIQLACSDAARTKTFFVEELGFVWREEGAGRFRASHGAVEICYWQVAPAGDARAIARASACEVAVADLGALLRHFRARHLDFKTEKQPWGSIECLVCDPDGNHIRFSSDA